jgi:hypothetical protein
MKVIYVGLFVTLLSSCTLPLLLGHLEYPDFDKTYEFNFSKEMLKDKIIDQYSYDVGLLSKNLGRTLIENPEVDKKYRLDKTNWDNYKDEIRKSLKDTVDIHIVKHHSRKSIYLKLIIDGDEHKAKLRIINVTADRRRECTKPKDFYKEKIVKRIESKFIEDLN